MISVPEEVAVKEEDLRRILRNAVSDDAQLLVAYSGGVDSAYLAWVAHTTLGHRAKAVIADSPSLPRKELAAAIAFARSYGITLEVITTHELESDAYARNDVTRCYHCKDELFRVIYALAEAHPAAKIAYGRNLDDRGDFRPGQRAAEQHAVLAPLVEARLGKEEIRSLARRAGLSPWSKPASACLASRVEYGRTVSVEVLAQIETAEDFLSALGFSQTRVRHHGDVARIEIERSELPKALSLEMMDRISSGVKAAGFKYVTLDVNGYRSGSMNDVVPVEMLLRQAS